MNHQACKLQDLRLQLAVCHLYTLKPDGQLEFQVAAEVYYPENVDGYFCENCGQFFDVERKPRAAAKEQRIQQAWQRALHHLHEAAYVDRDTGEALTKAMPPKELAGTKTALLVGLHATGAKGGAA